MIVMCFWLSGCRSSIASLPRWRAGGVLFALAYRTIRAICKNFSSHPRSCVVMNSLELDDNLLNKLKNGFLAFLALTDNLLEIPCWLWGDHPEIPTCDASE